MIYSLGCEICDIDSRCRAESFLFSTKTSLVPYALSTKREGCMSNYYVDADGRCGRSSRHLTSYLRRFVSRLTNVTGRCGAESLRQKSYFVMMRPECDIPMLSGRSPYFPPTLSSLFRQSGPRFFTSATYHQVLMFPKNVLFCIKSFVSNFRKVFFFLLTVISASASPLLLASSTLVHLIETKRRPLFIENILSSAGTIQWQSSTSDYPLQHCVLCTI